MQLNFPNYSFKMKKENGRMFIFDRLRKKHVALQPEEWVRQHMIEFLIEEKKYPPSLIGNEISLMLNGMQKRCDSVVYDRDGSPLMIIEYKAPSVKISQDTFDQILVYNTQLCVKYLLVSNGLQHCCCVVNLTNRTFSFLEEIPEFDSLITKK